MSGVLSPVELFQQSLRRSDVTSHVPADPERSIKSAAARNVSQKTSVVRLVAFSKNVKDMKLASKNIQVE
jgi:hypothetical protein